MTKPQRTAGRTRRRRRDERRPYTVIAAALVTLVLSGIALVIGLRAPTGLPLRDYRTLYVSFYDAGNLQPRNDVKIAGIRVGQVIDVRPRDGKAIAELQLDPGTAAPSKDVGAALRARGLLGARYVELIPGRAQEKLPDGAVVRARPDALAYGVPETLETFNAQTRGALGSTVRALGTGLLGRGDELNAALKAGPGPATQFPELVETVLARGDAVRSLAPSLEQGTAALDAAREDIAEGLAPTADALTPFAQRRDDLGRAIEQAPATLRSVRGGLRDGSHLLAATRSLARAARDVLPAAPAALRQTTALMDESHRPLERTQGLLRAARPAVPTTLLLLRRLSPLLDPLAKALGDLDPLVGRLADYGCDIDNFAENWRSALGFGVDTPSGGTKVASGPIGPIQNFRILVIAGAQSLHDVSGTKDTLAAHDPYPRPCTYSPGSTYPLFAVDNAARKASR